MKRFEQLGIKAVGALPGLANVSGSLEANEQRGAITLANRDMLLPASIPARPSKPSPRRGPGGALPVDAERLLAVPLELGDVVADVVDHLQTQVGRPQPPQIDIGRDVRLETGDTVVLSTDGFWAQIPPQVLGTMLKRQPITTLFPSLIAEAHRRAQGESDNISVVAMTWENQEDSAVSDTLSMDEEQFATSMNTTQPLGREGPAEDVTDDEIERAIAEIQSAIRKVPR